MEDEPLLESGDEGGGCCSCCCLCLSRALLALVFLSISLAPLVCLLIGLGVIPVHVSAAVLAGLAVGVPILCLVIIFFPVCCINDPYPIGGGCTSLSVRDGDFGIAYFKKLKGFYDKAKPGGLPDWREGLAEWFASFTEDDPDVGLGLGTNSKMYYSHAVCEQKLRQMGANIAAGNLERESALALAVFNNIAWQSAGKFALGATNEAHAIFRPYLVRMFGAGAWSREQVRALFRGFFASVDEIDNNNQAPFRGKKDMTSPGHSYDIVTQWTIKIIHTIGLDMAITDEEASELAELQNTVMAVNGAPTCVVKSFAFWAFFTKPVLMLKAKWEARYRAAVRRKWPGDDWSEQNLNYVASAFFDAILYAGGRSVPLAIDLVMAYMLTTDENKPESIRGVDFTNEGNVLALMMECMRLHAPVTTLPYWIRGQGGDEPEWVNECICLDRALSDPRVFPDPDAMILNRPGNDSGPGSKSMAWGDFAVVNDDDSHPDSHRCPGKDLSIEMVLAFVAEYQAAGPWEVDDDDIQISYYGAKKGWLVRKAR